jgi:hypothetical protein
MHDGRTTGAEIVRITLRTDRLSPGALDDAAELLPQTDLASGEPFDAVGACRALLSARALIGVSVSRSGPGNAARIVGIGAGVFVSDEAARQIRAESVPGVSERILRAGLDGPALSLDSHELFAQNARDGLNVVVVLHHHVAGLDATAQRQVRGELTGAFLNDMRGYRLREVLAECSDDELEWAVTHGGFRIRNDYEEWYRQQAEPAHRRILLGFERADATTLQGTVLELLFHYQPPRLRFTASQRRLLAQAVLHKTDAEIAGDLAVSVSAVKKTWAAVFDQAGELLGESGDVIEHRGAAATRGLQKRHKLLAYLREHPEELKP